jgi:hypothetical protein
MVVVVVAVVVASAPAVGVVGVIAGAAAAGYDATVVFVVVIVIVVVVDQAEADILYLPPLVTALRAFLAKAMPPIPRQQIDDLVFFRRRREVHRRAGRVVLVAEVDV